jgi:hypothetical protein
MSSRLWNALRLVTRSLSRAPGVAAAVVAAFACGGGGGALHAQPASVADRLVSSWVLVSLEKQAGSATPGPARAPRGLLVLDGAGNVFEFFQATPPRAEGAPVPTGALLTFEEYGGFWGRYTVDEPANRMNFIAESGVSPNLNNLRFSRSFELAGDRLVVTSTDEPQAQGHTRWVWQRFPTVENLSPAYREVAGFWRNIGERQVVQATGAIERESQRGPAVIVYTPAGFVGVHFPPRGREPFAGATATEEEAQAAMRGYIGYFGGLGVYPGEVSHNILAGVPNMGGAILRRYAEITGDELIVRLQGTVRTSNEPPRVATEVLLKRLSGADDMLPR